MDTLIQRLGKPYGRPNPFSFGGGLANGGLSQQSANYLSGIFSFDYMGSAEFEWGTVPAAFKFIAEQSSQNKMVTGQINGVYYICPTSYENGVKVTITNLLDDERQSFRLKEYCGLADHFNGRGNTETFGWVELDNGFMFFVDQDMFEQTKKLFGIS